MGTLQEMGKLMVEDRIGVLLLWWESLGGHNRRQMAGEDEGGHGRVAREPYIFDVQAWLFVSLSAQISLSPGTMAVALTILRVYSGITY